MSYTAACDQGAIEMSSPLLGSSHVIRHNIQSMVSAVEQRLCPSTLLFSSYIHNYYN